MKERANEQSNAIIGAAIEVHRHLGPGLLESIYEECLCAELDLGKIAYERQFPIEIDYKNMKLCIGYRIDMLVDKLVVVELKSVKKIEEVDEAQVLTYLKLSNCWLGLLLNFNVPVLRDGIKRLVLG